jgi:hypothetical protein
VLGVLMMMPPDSDACDMQTVQSPETREPAPCVAAVAGQDGRSVRMCPVEDGSNPRGARRSN